MIDDDHIDGAFLRLQFEPELRLDGSENIRKRFGFGACA